MEKDYENRWCNFQKFLLTNVEDNTNALFVVIKHGYKVEDLQPKASINYLISFI